jgi:hypothetical protein
MLSAVIEVIMRIMSWHLFEYFKYISKNIDQIRFFLKIKTLSKIYWFLLDTTIT